MTIGLWLLLCVALAGVGLLAGAAIEGARRDAADIRARARRDAEWDREHLGGPS